MGVVPDLIFPLALKEENPMDATQNTQAGTIKWFDPHKGYGFIRPEAGGEDIFIHKTVVLSCGNPDLRDGMKVTYAAEPAPRTGKMRAKSVALVGAPA